MSEFAIFLTSMILTGVFLVFCIAVDLCSIVRKSRVVKPVEFLPPEGFSPLDAVFGAKRESEFLSQSAAALLGGSGLRLDRRGRQGSESKRIERPASLL